MDDVVAEMEPGNTSDEAGHRLDALVMLAMRAAGAHGAVLHLAGMDGVARCGEAEGESLDVPLSAEDGASLGRLELWGAQSPEGLSDPVGALVAAHLERIAAAGSVSRMRARLALMESDLEARNSPRPHTLAAFLRAQSEDFDARPDAAPDEAQAMVADAKVRVLIVEVLQRALDAATVSAGAVEIARLLPGFIEELERILPASIDFAVRAEPLVVSRSQASAICLVLTEFSLATSRDAFPRPTRHHVIAGVGAQPEDGGERVTLELHHRSKGYDTRVWKAGVPALSSRIAENVATEVGGLVVMVRDVNKADPGLCLRFVFDRPAD